MLLLVAGAGVQAVEVFGEFVDARIALDEDGAVARGGGGGRQVEPEV